MKALRIARATGQPRRRRAGALALALLLGLPIILAACGRKGAPVPPGPPEKVIYPRTYPTR